MSKRSLLVLFSIIAMILATVGMVLTYSHTIIAFVLVGIALIPAYIAHVLDRLEEDEREY